MAGIDAFRVLEAPHYQPQGREVELFEAAYAAAFGEKLGLTATSDDDTRNGSMPMSIRRVTADGASFVCRVENTR